MERSEILNYVLLQKGWSYSKIGKKIGYGETTVKTVVVGKRNVSVDFWEKLERLVIADKKKPEAITATELNLIRRRSSHVEKTPTKEMLLNMIEQMKRMVENL